MKRIRFDQKSIFLAVCAITFFIAIAIGIHFLQSNRYAYLHHLPKWKAGTSYRYVLDYQANESNALRIRDKKAAFSGQFSVKGDLLIKAYQASKKGAVLGLSLKNLKTISLESLGKELFADLSVAKTIFENDEAFLRINAEGEITELKFRSKSQDAFRQLIHALAEELAFSYKLDESTWTTLHRSLRGEAETHFSVEDINRKKQCVHRKKSRYASLRSFSDISDFYQNIESNAALVLSTDGIESLESHEDIEILNPDGEDVVLAKTSTSLKLVEKTVFSSSSETLAKSFHKIQKELSAMDRLEIGQLVQSKAAEERLLKRVVNGLSVDNILVAISLPGELPRDILFRSIALIRLNPDVLGKIESAFLASANQGRARVILSTMLSVADTKESQILLTKILRDQNVQQDSSFASIVAQLSFIKHPRPQILQLVAELQDHSRAQKSATLALGAVIGQAYRHQEQQSALKHNQELIDTLRAAESIGNKLAIIGALGNAGLHENIETLTKLGKDQSADIRAKAAIALRKTQTVESERVLTNLISDESSKVAFSAIRSISHYRVGKATLEQLEQKLTTGSIHQQTYADLANLALKQAKLGQKRAARSLVDQMLEQKIKNPSMRRAIERIYKAIKRS